MILTGPEIIKQHEARQVIIDPFSTEQITPNSYDFRLGGEIRKYAVPVLDARQDMATEVVPWTKTENDDGDSMVLHPGTIYLAHSEEVMGSSHFAPMIKGKSSIARLGLFVHIAAGLIDPGFVGQWTLTLYAVQPVRVYRGMLIGQATFWTLDGTAAAYRKTATPSLGIEKSDSHLHFST